MPNIGETTVRCVRFAVTALTGCLILVNIGVLSAPTALLILYPISLCLGLPILLFCIMLYDLSRLVGAIFSIADRPGFTKASATEEHGYRTQGAGNNLICGGRYCFSAVE